MLDRPSTQNAYRMLSEGDIIINKVAQDKLTLDDGLLWFKTFNIPEQRSILGWIRLYLEQSHPDQALIDESIGKVPLKSTMTPIVIFKTSIFKIAASKVCDLPDTELEKSFLTLMTLFKYADTKRRNTSCRNGCEHEWHNLDNKTKSGIVDFFSRIKHIFRPAK